MKHVLLKHASRNWQNKATEAILENYLEEILIHFFMCTIQMIVSVMRIVPLEKDDRNVVLTLADIINNLL